MCIYIHKENLKQTKEHQIRRKYEHKHKTNSKQEYTKENTQ